MKIAYIRSTFPKNSETFILEEILYLKRAGHDVRIFANWSDLSKLNGKIIDQELLGNVVYSRARTSPWSVQLKFIRTFLWQMRAKRYRNFFRYDFVPSRDLDAELAQLWKRKFAQMGWLKRAFLQSLEAWQLYVTGMRKNNLSVAKSQFILQHDDFAPDHIHCPFLFAGDVAILSRLRLQFPQVPYSVTLRSRDVYLEAADAEYVHRRNQLIEHADRVFTISQYNKVQLSPLFSIKGSMKVVHSSIDSALFTPDPSIAATPDQMVCIARLVPKKGLDVLIDACATLRERGLPFQLSIVGSGALKAALQSQIDALGLGAVVHIIGPFRQKVIREILNQAEIFVLPCVVANDGDRDILPNSIKEAMAMERLVVTSKVSGIDELVLNGINGLLCAPNDALDLAEKLQFGLKNKDRAKWIGKKAREKILDEFDIESQGRLLNEELTRIAIKRSAATTKVAGFNAGDAGGVAEADRERQWQPY